MLSEWSGDCEMWLNSWLYLMPRHLCVYVLRLIIIIDSCMHKEITSATGRRQRGRQMTVRLVHFRETVYRMGQISNTLMLALTMKWLRCYNALFVLPNCLARFRITAEHDKCGRVGLLRGRGGLRHFLRYQLTPPRLLMSNTCSICCGVRNTITLSAKVCPSHLVHSLVELTAPQC